MDRFVNYHFHPRELQGKKKCIAVDKYVLTGFSENTLLLKNKYISDHFLNLCFFCSSRILDNCLSSIYYESSDGSSEIRDSKFSILYI